MDYFKERTSSCSTVRFLSVTINPSGFSSFFSKVFSVSITLFDLVVCWTTLGPVWDANCLQDSARATRRSPRLFCTAFWYACNRTSHRLAGQVGRASYYLLGIVSRTEISPRDKPDRPALVLALREQVERKVFLTVKVARRDSRCRMRLTSLWKNVTRMYWCE